jgi:hypothetical protein
MAKASRQRKPTTVPRAKPGGRPFPTTPKELLRYAERPGLSDDERARIGAAVAVLERLDQVVDLTSKGLNVLVKAQPAPGLEERIGEAVASAVEAALAGLEERIATAVAGVLDEAIAGAEARAVAAEPGREAAPEPSAPKRAPMTYDGDELDRWNAEHPVGTAVRFMPVRGRPEYEDTRTTSEAWALGSGDFVVKVEGRTGGVAVDHLTVIRPACDPPGAEGADLSPEVTALLAAVASVKRWQDLVPFYHAALREHAGDIGEPWPRIHAAIVGRWSTGTRERIKKAAWKLEGVTA